MAWLHNKQVEMAHKYCLSKTKVNLSSATFEDAEFSGFSACLTKYQITSKIYKEEAALFANRI